MALVPKAPLKRALHDSKGYRVSDDAVAVFQEYIDELICSIADDVSAITENRGVITISSKDIETALNIGY